LTGTTRNPGTQQRERVERAILPHLDAAYNLARWFTGNAHDADDVVQDASVRALTFFDSFRGEDGRGWLLTIVRNTCYDWLRKNRSQALVAVEQLDLESAPGRRQVPKPSSCARRMGARCKAAAVLRNYAK